MVIIEWWLFCSSPHRLTNCLIILLPLEFFSVFVKQSFWPRFQQEATQWWICYYPCMHETDCRMWLTWDIEPLENCSSIVNDGVASNSELCNVVIEFKGGQRDFGKNRVMEREFSPWRWGMTYCPSSGTFPLILQCCTLNSNILISNYPFYSHVSFYS